MAKYNEIFELLDSKNIIYNVVEHPPALEMELADKYIEGHKGVRTKTLFLCDKKSKNFFLLLLDENKKIDIKALGSKFQLKGLKFCSEEKIKHKLDLIPGMVSPFGLLNNKEKDVKFIIDQDIYNETITVYPNDCERTVFMLGKNLVEVLKDIGSQVEVEKL